MFRSHRYQRCWHTQNNSLVIGSSIASKAHVADVYEDVARLRHVAKNLKAASVGRIRVAATPAFGLEVLPRAVASFRQLHEDAVFELETLHFEEITDALLESRIDIGLAFDPESSPGIEEQQLASGRFVVLARNAETFDGRTTLSVDDLKAHPFIGLDSRGPLGRSLSAYISSSHTDLEIVAWAESRQGTCSVRCRCDHRR